MVKNAAKSHKSAFIIENHRNGSPYTTHDTEPIQNFQFTIHSISTAGYVTLCVWLTVSPLTACHSFCDFGKAIL